jgi:hypothetical protein
VLHASAASLAKVLESGDSGAENLRMLDLLLRASKARQEHNHAHSLTTYWTVIEKLQQRLWTQLQHDHQIRKGETFIGATRRKRLNDGRAFTAAVISEVLSLMGYLPFDLHEMLDLVRKSRNDWMHNLKVPDGSDARTASEAAQALAKLVLSIDIDGEVPLHIHS